ncbi:MAG: hypothetical protein AAEJ04_09355 [Planctomycetota bacterium]
MIIKNDTQGPFRPTSENRLRSSLELAQELLDARKLAKEGSDSAKVTVQILESILEIKPTSLAELDRALEDAQIPDSVRKRFDNWRGVQPITTVLKGYVTKIRGIAKDDKVARNLEFKKAAAQMLGLYRDGITLSDPRQGIFSDYWRLVFEGALADQDTEVALLALSTYRKAFGARPDLKNRIDLMANRLEALKKGLEKSSAEEDGDSQ